MVMAQDMSYYYTSGGLRLAGKVSWICSGLTTRIGGFPPVNMARHMNQEVFFFSMAFGWPGTAGEIQVTWARSQKASADATIKLMSL